MELFKTGHIQLRSPRGNELQVAVAGDVCFELLGASAVSEVLGGRSGAILAGVQPFLESADLRLIQWETVLGENKTPLNKPGPKVIAPAGCVRFAREGCFDVAMLANNHIGDFGPAAALETRDTLEREGILTVGVGENLARASRLLTLEKNGLRLGILNVAEHEFGIATATQAGAAPLDPLENIRQIRQAKEECDVVLAVLHGGVEHFPFPTPRTVQVCRAMAEAGAAAVINIHPHIPQGIEIHQGTPIFYSPGNFFFVAQEDRYPASHWWWHGYLPKITFDSGGAVAVEILPYRVRRDPWRIEPFEEPDRAACLRHLGRISEPLADPAALQSRLDSWSAERGVPMLEALCGGQIRWPRDLTDSAQVLEVMGLRNWFTCQAHHEVLTNALRLVETFRVGEARQRFPEIAQFQQPDFLTRSKC